MTPPPPDDPISFDNLEFRINEVQQDQMMGLLDWINLQTNIAGPDGSRTYTDSTAAGIDTRFYRSAQP